MGNEKQRNTPDRHAREHLFQWFYSTRWHQPSPSAAPSAPRVGRPIVHHCWRATFTLKTTKGVNKFSFSFPRNLLAFKTVGKNRVEPGIQPITISDNLCHGLIPKTCSPRRSKANTPSALSTSITWS